MNYALTLFAFQPRSCRTFSRYILPLHKVLLRNAIFQFKSIFSQNIALVFIQSFILFMCVNFLIAKPRNVELIAKISKCFIKRVYYSYSLFTNLYVMIVSSTCFVMLDYIVLTFFLFCEYF